jgi:hypothetical protein
MAWGPVLKSPLPYTGCEDGKNATIYSSFNGPQNWQIFCGFDMPSNDLIQTNTPNLDLCIETCANWNVQGITPTCMGVAFVPKFILGGQDSAANGPSDCYLKSNATIGLLSDKSQDEDVFVSVISQDQ